MYAGRKITPSRRQLVIWNMRLSSAMSGCRIAGLRKLMTVAGNGPRTVVLEVDVTDYVTVSIVDRVLNSLAGLCRFPEAGPGP